MPKKYIALGIRKRLIIGQKMFHYGQGANSEVSLGITFLGGAIPMLRIYPLTHGKP